MNTIKNFGENMLVSFNPCISNNKSVNFGKNPYIETRKIRTEAEAEILRDFWEDITEEKSEIADLDFAIKQNLDRGKKGVAFVLQDIKDRLLNKIKSK